MMISNTNPSSVALLSEQPEAPRLLHVLRHGRANCTRHRTPKRKHGKLGRRPQGGKEDLVVREVSF